MTDMELQNAPFVHYRRRNGENPKFNLREIARQSFSVVKIKYRRVLPSVTFKYHQPRIHESQDVKRKVDEPRDKIHSNRLIIYLLALHFLFIRTAFQ